jgi:hypothetical protein
VTANQDTSDVFATWQPWIVQPRMIAERLAGMTGLGEPVLSQPPRSLWGLPLPGALSAAQLDSFARRIAAQRKQHRGAAGTAGRAAWATARNWRFVP